LTNFLRDLPKWPGWLLLVLCGLVATFYGAVGRADILKVHVEVESPARYIVLAIGVIIALAGVVALLVGPRANRLPIEDISIEGYDTSPTPYPLAWVRGKVTPKKAGVKVWLLREDLAQRGGLFFPATLPAITDTNGQWRQSASLWKPGPFRIHAVVTTEEYDEFYRLYRECYDAALAICRKQTPGTYDVPDWPRFKDLPEDSISSHCGPVPYPG
jgi:hypothetical protein